MRIVFVFPPFDHKKFEEDIDVVSREFTQPPPLGLAYAAAIAEKSGHDAIIIDANLRPRMSKEDVLAQINEFKPQILSFMLTAYMFQQTLEWIVFLKQKTGLPVLVGNILMELYPKEVFSHREIDFGIIGSAQKPLPALLRALENGGSLEGIKGLCYRENGQLVIQPPDTLREDFDSLPFPARHLLANDRYYTVVSKRKNFTIMMTSKGCVSRCGFCHVKDIPYSARSPVGVADELEECYGRHGIREIEFFDPVFTVNRARVREICLEIRRRGLDISWACRARVDQVDEELLREMKAAGCARIYYGLECGNQAILDKTSKGITLERIREVVRITQNCGILTLGFFLIGAPGETVRTIEETIRFAMSLGLDYAQFHKTVAKPKTLLYDEVMRTTGRDYWGEFVMGTAKEERLPTPWTVVSDGDIEKLTVRAYRRFYFQPSRLWKIFRGIKSFSEFGRYVRSAVGIWRVKSDLHGRRIAP
ncbi:MAG TPA: radical SAM protein [Elusimicrobiota bacterium]|nr:radical SAM protein [Elusimicrobiota bacterium]